jgi:hypothetical protein
MANASGTDIKRAPPSTAFYQVRRPTESNSNNGSLGINYPLFFVGSVIIAVIIFAIRDKQRNVVSGIGLIVTPDPNSEVYQILNLTESIETGVRKVNVNP